jgi:hypothetical protein
MLPEIEKAGSISQLLTPEFRSVIDAVHARGGKCFTYMNPFPGVYFPEMHRRNEGLGTWRAGFDGSMKWAYSDNRGNSMFYGNVWRTADGVLDTLVWEGFREGVDDVRYLTTLLDGMKKAEGNAAARDLITETKKWIDDIDVVNGNLNQIRGEMAQRIEKLTAMAK